MTRKEAVEFVEKKINNQKFDGRSGILNPPFITYLHAHCFQVHFCDFTTPNSLCWKVWMKNTDAQKRVPYRYWAWWHVALLFSFPSRQPLLSLALRVLIDSESSNLKEALIHNHGASHAVRVTLSCSCLPLSCKIPCKGVSYSKQYIWHNFYLYSIRVASRRHDSECTWLIDIPLVDYESAWDSEEALVVDVDRPSTQPPSESEWCEFVRGTFVHIHYIPFFTDNLSRFSQTVPLPAGHLKKSKNLKMLHIVFQKLSTLG